MTPLGLEGLDRLRRELTRCKRRAVTRVEAPGRVELPTNGLGMPCVSSLQRTRRSEKGEKVSQIEVCMDRWTKSARAVYSESERIQPCTQGFDPKSLSGTAT